MEVTLKGLSLQARSLKVLIYSLTLKLTTLKGLQHASELCLLYSIPIQSVMCPTNGHSAMPLNSELFPTIASSGCIIDSLNMMLPSMENPATFILAS